MNPHQIVESCRKVLSFFGHETADIKLLDRYTLRITLADGESTFWQTEPPYSQQHPYFCNHTFNDFAGMITVWMMSIKNSERMCPNCFERMALVYGDDDVSASAFYICKDCPPDED